MQNLSILLNIGNILNSGKWLFFFEFFSVLLPESSSDSKKKTTVKWCSSNPEFNEQVKIQRFNLKRNFFQILFSLCFWPTSLTFQNKVWQSPSGITAKENKMTTSVWIRVNIIICYNSVLTFLIHWYSYFCRRSYSRIK